eukprot:CAMPEP_0197194344 /NCGR_PEP_ID=MMETSP1423-20130617/29087_1 /TAXON_ID=476441 /ORGANISM="Pseudo-nitzschia heimii, Strain UNC1101" /LENGTH=52 /DNA_ID=CAMNT_0042647759 /DNA_START=152 /DNA_END=308 /DNA_ORIENTATION=+
MEKKVAPDVFDDFPGRERCQDGTERDSGMRHDHVQSRFDETDHRQSIGGHRA